MNIFLSIILLMGAILGFAGLVQIWYKPGYVENTRDKLLVIFVFITLFICTTIFLGEAISLLIS